MLFRDWEGLLNGAKTAFSQLPPKIGLEELCLEINALTLA
jgi:hypothetical protein